jgi:VanZ family protein
MPFRFYLPALLWALFILFLTMMPGKYIPPVNIWDFANVDKLVHLFVFMVLMLLLLYAFLRHQLVKAFYLPLLFTAFLICVSYGLLIEIMQGTLLTDRHFELYDALANATGCVLGGILFKYRLQAIMAKRFRF